MGFSDLFFSIEKLNEKEILHQKYRKRERGRDRSLAVVRSRMGWET